MKKKLLIALLTMFSAGAIATAAACTPETEPDPHTCGHVCPTCQKCLSDCEDEVCQDKCEGHEIGTPVTKINVLTDDEENDGTLSSPFVVTVAKGKSEAFTYNVQPSAATNKTVEWKVGAIEDNAFVEKTDSGISVTATANQITVAASAEATAAVIEGKAADGSGVCVYLSVEIDDYTAVTAITSSTLTASEDENYDYELTTALHTNWDIGGGMLQRGQKLLNGDIFGGKQAPRNITYFANLYNFGIQVAPAEATEKDVTVSYGTEGIVEVDPVTGALTVKKAGETVVTVASYANPEVTMKVKVTVVDSLYRGVLKSEYDAADDAANVAGGWDLDADHAQAAQDSRYDDWHLVMVHTNTKRGGIGDDNNQKIFYMGAADRPYGICIENNVGESTGASLENSAGAMWAKLTVPASAVTFNVKIANNDKVHGQYRVVFVKEDGTVTELSAGWVSFASPVSESTQKFAIPEAIKGEKGAMVIEHRLTQYDNNAELQIKVLKFEGNVEVESVEFVKAAQTYKTGAREFDIKAVVKPDNATNDKVTYAMAADSAEGVTVDANTGKVTVTAEAAAGVYEIIATSVGDPTKTATYTLTLVEEEVEINEWTTTDEILNGVENVKWNKIGTVDSYNEGAAIRGNGTEWRAISLENRKINASSFILTFGARTFVRPAADQEPFGKIEVRVIEGDNEAVVIRAIGQTEDKIIIDTDDYKTLSYDLSAYIGKTVTVQIGVSEVVAQTKNDNCTTAVKPIKFTGNADGVNSWADKSELLDAEHDAWGHEGEWREGVGEGLCITRTGSYIYNAFVIGKNYNALFTFSARVFLGSGEVYPDVKVIVVTDDGQEHVIRAIDADGDTVHIESESPLSFSYDLSEFAGQEVTIKVILVNENVTNCCFTSIKMEAAPDTGVTPPEGGEVTPPEGGETEGGNEGGEEGTNPPEGTDTEEQNQ